MPAPPSECLLPTVKSGPALEAAAGAAGPAFLPREGWGRGRVQACAIHPLPPWQLEAPPVGQPGLRTSSPNASEGQEGSEPGAAAFGPDVATSDRAHLHLLLR